MTLPAAPTPPAPLRGRMDFWKDGDGSTYPLHLFCGDWGRYSLRPNTRHLDPKTGRLLPTDLHATPLITPPPACQPISIRCATWGGGYDEPSELASTSLSTAPHYPNLLGIKSAQTTWLCKATPIHILSVKTVKVKEPLTSCQWQPPRAMAPAGILFKDVRI